MAALTTRQWRALSAMLCLMFLLALLGLTERDGRVISLQPSPGYEALTDDWNNVAIPEPVAKPRTSSTSSASTTRVHIGVSSSTVQTDSTMTVAAHPTQVALTKAIVMGYVESEDISWVAENMVGWQQAIYRVDALNGTSPTGHSTKLNKGREAMPYLTYIIDHYDSLPDVMAFVHPHRSGYPQAWHNDAPGYDAVTMLNRLQLPYVAERGYVNLRCNTAVGCPNEVRPWREPPDLERSQEHAFPYFYSVFFDRTLEEARQEIDVVATACCAQFAVSREQVHKRPKAQYEKIRRVIDTTKYDDYTSGRVMEYMWHILFGMEKVHCPDASECYCNVYGSC